MSACASSLSSHVHRRWSISGTIRLWSSRSRWSLPMIPKQWLSTPVVSTFWWLLPTKWAWWMSSHNRSKSTILCKWKIARRLGLATEDTCLQRADSTRVFTSSTFTPLNAHWICNAKDTPSSEVSTGLRMIVASAALAATLLTSIISHTSESRSRELWIGTAS